jgi:hypothetical protein
MFMNKNKLFLIVLILFTLPSFAQSKLELAKNGLPKDARVIVINTDNNPKQFERIAEILFTEGYEIRKKDQESGIIQTSFKRIKGGWHVKLLIGYTSESIKIRGDCSADRVGGHEITNTGGKNSLKQIGFMEMDRIAKKFPSIKVDYLQ